MKCIAILEVACLLLVFPAVVRADAVKLVRVVVPPQGGPVMEAVAQVFARQVGDRCDAKVVFSGEGALRVELGIDPTVGAEGFRIADGPAVVVRVTGGDARGLLYGVGKFLRASRYDQGGFTPGAWRGTSAPQCPFRAVYAATHFMNYYEAAPADEVQRYVEDLGLWGANAFIVHFPTWTFKGFDDPAARRNLDRIRGLLKAAKAVGLRVGLVQCVNQGFATAPQEIRAAKHRDDLKRRGYFGINCCPSIPAGHDYLMKLYAGLFDEYKDVGLDYLVCWPYDEGGCGCEQCRPWGARAYPQLSKDVAALARARHPDLKVVLSTWVYDTPPEGEWEGLTRFLEKDRDWVDYIMADSHGDFPRYPLEKGVPGGRPLVSFPEISMWGRSPWGGYGANPLPARYEGLWRQADGKLSGGMPYSEGIYEDINKVIFLQLYWKKDSRAEDAVREYLAFEYSPDVADDLLRAVRLLEETWSKQGPKSEGAWALVQKAEARLTAQARSAWRWRILALRARIDAELAQRQGKMEGPVLKAAFEELTRLYHAENAHSMPVKPPQVP